MPRRWFNLNWLDAQSIVESFGDLAVIVVTLIIFLETAFVLTSFLPGDSLLFIIGLTIGVNPAGLPDWLAFVMIYLAAVLGTQVGYWVGKRVGPPLFSKNRGWLLNERVVARTHQFFERYGATAVILARFVPILRALVPMMAGVSGMDTRRFFKLNLLGATAWIGVFMAGGYFLGGVQLVKENLELAVAVVIVVSSLPLPIELLRHRLRQRRIRRRDLERAPAPNS